MNENKSITYYNKGKNFIANFIGVIFTFIGMVVIFFVASTTITKDIEVKDQIKSIQILEAYREKNGENTFPKHGEAFKLDKEYFFIVLESDNITKLPTKYKWIFQGGADFMYVLNDPTFWIIFGVSLMLSLYISFINYRSGKRKSKESERYLQTMRLYSETKEKTKQYFQYLPMFCNYKNKQIIDIRKSELLESVGLKLEDYNNGNIQEKIKLLDEETQIRAKKVLKKIEKIKINKLSQKDLLQESKAISLKIEKPLPMGEKEHELKFMIFGFFHKALTFFLSGFVLILGIVLGDWLTGLISCISLLSTAITSYYIAVDYTTSTLRNRFIAKNDLLVEFLNIKDMFIEQEIEKIEEVATPLLEQNNEKNSIIMNEEVLINNTFKEKEVAL